MNKLAVVLRESYGFPEENIRKLDSPTKAELFDAIETMAPTVPVDGSVLVIYAGASRESG